MGIDHKTFKKIINGIIENEYFNTVKNESEYFEANNEEFNAATRLTSALYDELKEGLTDEKKDLLEKLYTSLIDEQSITNRYFFTEGAIKGLTDLNYLNCVEDIKRYFLYKF